MVHEAIFELLAAKCPEAVMIRATLENALPPEFVDDVFQRVASKQYTRKLLFSSLIRLLSLVVCRVRPSVHAAFQMLSGELSVRPKSVYNKLNRTETAVSEAIVEESAQRMAAITDELKAPLTPLVPGYQTRIIDGNHLAPTEHRLEPLRTLGGGAQPGTALVVYDAERGLASKVYLCEDGHSQERDILVAAMDHFKAGECWIADRNFATSEMMWRLHVSKSVFIIRRHAANGRVRETGPWRWVGDCETGTVWERPIAISNEQGEEFPARSIQVRLKKPTRSSEAELEILSSCPASVDALTIAAAYRGRWRIETAFAELDRVFTGEISALGEPQAALLAFSLALVAYNTLAVFRAAMRQVHGEAKVQEDVSVYYVGLSTSSSWYAMDLWICPEEWTARYSPLSAAEMAARLIELAKRVDLRRVKKHRRGPKRPRPARVPVGKSNHFSTAQALGRTKGRQNA